MRRSRRLAADAKPIVVLTIGLGLTVVLASMATQGRTGDGGETSRATASASGDVATARPRPRRVVLTEQTDAAGEAVEDVADDPVGPGELADEVATVRRPDRLLRLLDDAGAPVEGVGVYGAAHGGKLSSRGGLHSSVSDARGEVCVPCDGERTVVDVLDRDGAREIELVELVTTVTVATPRMLDVGVVDGSTGVPLAGSTLGVQRMGEWSSARGGAVAFDTIEGLRVLPPAGYGCFASCTWDGPVAPRARRLRLSVAVYPGTTWTFRALDPDGTPVAGAAATSVELDSSSVTFVGETSAADGIVRVRDIPRIPYLRTLRVSLRGGGTCGSATNARFADGPPDGPVDFVLNGGGWYRGPPGEVPCCGFREDDPTPTAPLAVRVRWRDGVAAAYVRVVCCGVADATTDAEGRASFAALPVGPQFFVAGAHGFLPTAARAVVGRDETIDVAEDAPRIVHVLVTDEQGRALPAARVTVASERIAGPEDSLLEFHVSIAQLDGDVELLTPLTDGAGRVDVDAPRGEMNYHVVVGGGSASAYGEAGNDVHVTVTGER